MNIIWEAFSRTKSGNPEIKTLENNYARFYKLVKEKSPAYLFQLIPENNTHYTTRSDQKKVKCLFQDKN